MWYMNSRITPDGVDIVLDCLCGEECNRGYQLLKPMGRYILYGKNNIVQHLSDLVQEFFNFRLLNLGLEMRPRLFGR